MGPEYGFGREKYFLLHVEHLFCNSLSEVSPQISINPCCFVDLYVGLQLAKTFFHLCILGLF